MNKLINQDGTELPGGEAQKLMLAIALYKDAPLLILDEQTAALDPIAESKIYNQFSTISEKWELIPSLCRQTENIKNCSIYKAVGIKMMRKEEINNEIEEHLLKQCQYLLSIRRRRTQNEKV